MKRAREIIDVRYQILVGNRPRVQGSKSPLGLHSSFFFANMYSGEDHGLAEGLANPGFCSC